MLVNLSEQLAGPLWSFGKWLFLIGAAGTVFSSLPGVRQATPYIFADVCSLFHDPPDRSTDYKPRITSTADRVYQTYLVLLTFIPMIGLFTNFQQAQKLYAITGIFFIPLLTLALLLLNGRSQWIGSKHRNRYLSTLSLIATLVFFLWTANKIS